MSKVSLPSRLASPTGDGSTVLICICSVQPRVEDERRLRDLLLGLNRDPALVVEAAA